MGDLAQQPGAPGFGTGQLRRERSPEEKTPLENTYPTWALTRKSHGWPHLEAWARQAETSPVSELRGFVKGLSKDWAAVTVGLTVSYSSGAVESHVKRIILWNSPLSQSTESMFGGNPRKVEASSTLRARIPQNLQDDQTTDVRLRETRPAPLTCPARRLTRSRQLSRATFLTATDTHRGTTQKKGRVVVGTAGAA
jgi:hypothetical protein